MAIHRLNDAAVVRNGDLTTIILAPSREVTADLRILLAKVNGRGEGDTPKGVRQLLHDLEGAMQEAFRPKHRRGAIHYPGDDCD